MSTKAHLKSDPVGFDARQQPAQEQQANDGPYGSDADTVPIRTLQENAEAILSQAAPAPEGFDPYSSAMPEKGSAKPRRTLDDMRKLSEEIKKTRQPPNK